MRRRGTNCPRCGHLLNSHFLSPLIAIFIVGWGLNALDIYYTYHEIKRIMVAFLRASVSDMCVFHSLPTAGSPSRSPRAHAPKPQAIFDGSKKVEGVA
jgi:hypothetical protein